MVVVKPADAGNEGVLPIKLSLDVGPSNRLKDVISLCEWPASMLAGSSPSKGGGKAVAVPSDALVPDLVMQLSNEDDGPGYLPQVKAQLVTANGEKLDTTQLKPMNMMLKLQV